MFIHLSVTFINANFNIDYLQMKKSTISPCIIYKNNIHTQKANGAHIHDLNWTNTKMN